MPRIMPPFERHVFVCTNRRADGHHRGCCASKGSDDLRDLLKKAAETALGEYFYAPTPEELDAKFDEILQNIYVRLIR